MANPARKVNICQYTVKEGKEAEMEALLAKHYPALKKAGLVEHPPVVYRGLSSGKPGGNHGAARTFVEIFSWKDNNGPELAHQSPDVMAVWEPMGAICERMEFPHFVPLDLHYPE
jgi:hypothetical protein